MQLVLCDENTVQYIKIYLKCVFGFKIMISKNIILKWSNVFLSNLEKVLYLIPKYPRNCLRVILFIFLLTIFGQVAYTTITELFPNCSPAFPLHFHFIGNSWEWRMTRKYTHMTNNLQCTVIAFTVLSKKKKRIIPLQIKSEG